MPEPLLITPKALAATTWKFVSADRLHQPAGDFASMISLGISPRRLPAVPAQVLEQLRGHGQVAIVPEVFRSGYRGPSSYLFTSDRSRLSAFVPSFGPNPWARSPEELAQLLLAAGIDCAICSGVPAPWVREFAVMEGEEIKPYAVAPVAAAPPKREITPQLDLFGEAA